KSGKRYRVKGYPPETEVFTRLTDARRWAVQTEAAIRERRHCGSQESAKHTVEDLLGRYADEVLESFAANERRNRVRQLGWWRKQVGHLPLWEVTPAVISEALGPPKSGSGPSGRAVSAATRNRYLSALSHALT